jgi:hypothetical protein
MIDLRQLRGEAYPNCVESMATLFDRHFVERFQSGSLALLRADATLARPLSPGKG